MIRRMLTSTALILALTASTYFSAVSTNTAAAAPPSCSGTCIINRNSCNAACNGNAECLSICQAEYDCCILACHGSSCRQGTGKPVRSKH